MRESLNQKIIKSSIGFTLIELLVVTSVLLVIIGTVGGLFFSSLRGANKTSLTNEAKQNGDYAVAVIVRTIKTAKEIIDSQTICDNSSLTQIGVINPDGSQTDFICDSVTDKIGMNTTVGGSLIKEEFLTSPKVRVNSCSFVCSRAAPNAAPVVKIQFSVGQAVIDPNVPLRPDQQALVEYETSVQMRNTF